MSKIVVSATNKGGEGKTTTSINLCEYFALMQKKRVLAIDLDPQANFSGRYLKMEYNQTAECSKMPPVHPEYQEEKDWDGRSSIADIFYGNEVVAYPTRIETLDIIPAESEKLQSAENMSKEQIVERIYRQLTMFLKLKELRNQYDVIVIDTPPSKGPLTKAAIKSATHLIIPAQMEQFSIEGIYGMIQLFKQESYQRLEEFPIKLIGILPNQIRDIKLHQSLLEHLRQIRGISDYVMPTYVKKRAIYSEILLEGTKPQSLFEISNKRIERREIEEVCKFCSKQIFAEEA